MNEMATIDRTQREYSEAVKKALARKPQLYINGEWVDSSGSETIDVEDPSSGKVISSFVEATDKDIDRAVAAARAAFDDRRWRDLPPIVREKTMHRIADLIEEHADELAELEAIDVGKPKGMASAVDVPGAAAHFRYMAGWAGKIGGETQAPYAMPGGMMFAYTLKEPVGVCAQIVPWNFPLLMACLKIAPALAAGCTTVLKPAEQTSLTALRLADLIAEAGVPAGVVNIVTGYGHTSGDRMVKHPDVDKVAFTGSDRDRQADQPQCHRNAQACHPGTRRQEPGRGHARCQYCGDCTRRRRRDLLQLWPGLRGRIAALCPQVDLRQGGRGHGRNRTVLGTACLA